MNIIKTPPSLIENFKDRGRPNKYPFSSLSPGQTLVLENCTYEDLNRVKSAFYQYRKHNKLLWKSSVKMQKNTIYISRIN